MFKIQVRLKALDTVDPYQHLKQNCSVHLPWGTVLLLFFLLTAD